MKPVQFPALLSNLSTLKDGSIKVTVETQELSGKDAADLFAYRNLIGYVSFTPNATEVIEVPKETADYDSGKSPSQRLRGILYKLWAEQYKEKYDTFEQFYAVNMERIINQVKEKIDS